MESTNQRDPIPSFLQTCHDLHNRASYMIQAFPIAEMGAVENLTHQLYAVRSLLSAIEDEYLSTTDRIWVDMRRDCIEVFRQIFLYLEENELWDKSNLIHCVCLFLVYQPRIQAGLNAAKEAWNHHKIRTANNKTPVALFMQSKMELELRGIWEDPGDDIGCVDGWYGVEGIAEGDVGAIPHIDPEDPTAELLDDDEIQGARTLLKDFDWEQEDGNWGIDTYCKAVLLLTSIYDTSI
ncbi:hypothetical protein CYLTODRAFT_363702 [Cylindrobasidium torrendii FP15055 ss-10]|uniref:Integrase core domain-containing protein n=1 Tax=Cylindrobasidium torrendii FP15055 ss-10 TaxID=1314674 RepID=A0A0D7AU33_9AGAR|nr:hypothetical protein CYLTODRAFT_363702 [Cylindrobasidium torrendii FP15055 ss-10]